MAGRPGGASVPQLVVTHPPQLRGRVFRLAGGRSVLGRDPGCDLRLDDPFVSAAHAVLSRSGRALVLEDLGSANGTFVNGRPVRSPRTLRHGDVLTFGDVRAWYDDPGSFVRGRPYAEPTALIPVIDGAHWCGNGRRCRVRSRARAGWAVLLGLAILAAGGAAFSLGALRFGLPAPPW